MLRFLFKRLMAPAGEGDGGSGDGGSGDAGGDGTGDGGDGGDGGRTATILDSAGDSAGAGEAGAGESGDGEGASPWAWGENVPGAGTVPPWLKTEKFKTVSDQAKAFTDLETKIGPAAELIGAPEGEYEMPEFPDGVTGEWDPKDPMLVGFQKVAKEMGLSQVAFGKVAASMSEILATEKAADEQSVTDALAALGTNSAERVIAVKGFMTAKLGEENYNLLNDSIGTDVKAYLALEKLVGLAAGDAQLSILPGNTGPGFTKEDIGNERYKVFPEGHNLAGQVMYNHDADHRKRVDDMYKELFPGEDKQTVG